MTSIYIRTTSRATFSVAIDVVNDSIGSLKLGIHACASIPQEQYRLFVAGTEIFDDAKLLLECGIQNGTTIDLVWREGAQDVFGKAE